MIVAAVGAGCNGGVLFAFSAFVMPALQRLPTAQGVAAMQSINVTAVRPPFMLVFGGTALVCLALIVVALRTLDEAYAPWLIGPRCCTWSASSG